MFKDHFSHDPAGYRRYRPVYPDSLFEFLAGATPGRDAVWDCATGNGQAALGLAEHFHRVFATDASADQIRAAPTVGNIEYRVAPAEQSGLRAGCVDLVTVAQAVHWFDFNRFYREVDRVLKPGGVLAVWSYGLLRIEPAVDAVVDRFYRDVLGAYWPAERRWVETAYSDLPFPFTELEAPGFSVTASWEMRDMVGYLASWSAVRRYREAEGSDPLAVLLPALAEAWGDTTLTRGAEWPLALRIGR